MQPHWQHEYGIGGRDEDVEVDEGATDGRTGLDEDETVDEAGRDGAVEGDGDEESVGSTSVQFDSFEQVLKAVGSFGMYHWFFVAIMQFSIVMWCGNFVFMPYATYLPVIYCSFNDSIIEYDHRHPEAFCIPFEAELCSNVSWHAPLHTIVQQWQLICSNDHVPELINSLQMAGTFFALLFTGSLSDRFGRKRVFNVGFLLMLVATYLGTVAPTWQWLATSRFFVGGLMAATFLINFVWSMELTGQESNFVMNLAGLWHFGYMITALIGHLTADWKLYLLVLDAIGIPLLFVYTCFVESPRWLIQKGKLEKAARQLTHMGRGNLMVLYGMEITRDSLLTIPQERSNTRHGLLTLVTSRRLLLYTTLLSLITFATSSAAYAFVFQISLLTGSPFVKFAVYGAVRMYIPLLLYLLDKKVAWFGRRELIYVPMLVVFLFYLMATLSQVITGSSNFAAMLAGAVVCNCLWTGIGQYQMELFPTRLRTTSSSLVLLFDPLASVLMPQLVYAERYYQAAPVLEVTVVTFMATVAGYLLLPETKGRPLPDTLDDVAELGIDQAMRPWKQLRYWICGGPNEDLLANMEHDDDTSFDEGL